MNINLEPTPEEIDALKLHLEKLHSGEMAYDKLSPELQSHFDEFTYI